MAITTSYALTVLSQLEAVQNATANFDASSLAGGGTAFSAQGYSNRLSWNYDANGNLQSSDYSGFGNNPAITGLSNGSYVVAAQDDTNFNAIVFQIYSPTGTKSELFGGDTVYATNVDAAALANGGFVISEQIHFYGTNNDNDVHLLVYNAAGTFQRSIVVSSTLENDRNASIAVLNNGNIAVAYVHTAGTTDQVWYAVYKPDGTVVSAPTGLDAPRNDLKPVITSLADGGFAIAYVDGNMSDTNDIALAKFDASGTFKNLVDISNPAQGSDISNDANPAITRLSNGMLAVSWDNNIYAPDTDVRVALFDPTTMTTVGLSSFESTDIQTQSALAAHGAGQMALTVYDATHGTIDLAQLAAVRVLTGDDDFNKITAGNDMQHSLIGLGGNDTLIGGTLADTLDGGTGEDKLFGQAGNDVIYGGDGNDQVDGGTGADTMYGGTGNDTFEVDNVGDIVSEGSAQGNDTVTASVSYSLGSNVENLTLLGNGPLVGKGNGSPNTLIGNNGNNALYGNGGIDVLNGGSGNDTLYGGAKADTLTGGAGADRFVFDTLAASADKDTIIDFVHNTDKLAFTKAAFSAFSGDTAGQPISAAEFHLGATATASSQHVIYDSAIGALYYDSDGTGAAAQVLVATLIGHPTLTASDILVL